MHIHIYLHIIYPSHFPSRLYWLGQILPTLCSSLTLLFYFAWMPSWADFPSTLWFLLLSWIYLYKTHRESGLPGLLHLLVQ